MLSIDIGVGGRFHADRLADSLIESHNVHLWTSLPHSRFPALPSQRVHSILWPEVIYRAAKRLGFENHGDLAKIYSFSRQLAKQLTKSKGCDVFVGWSSFSLETLRLGKYRHTAVFRDSCHIRTQIELLEKEYEKFSLRLPNRKWVIEREEEEYERAGTVFVLSNFARQSFIERGFSPEKVRVIRLGADTSRFVIHHREKPVSPLKVVYFGSLSIRKGFHYLLDAVNALGPSQISLTAIGSIEGDFPKKKLTAVPFQHIPALPQAQLAASLGRFDVFVMPTLEDGFGQTLCQAMAAGLVPITTSACGAAEQIQAGINGIVVEPGSTSALIEALENFCRTPSKITQMRANLIGSRTSLGWGSYQKSLRAWAENLSDQGEQRERNI
jgi:glycosyltransferase involved in cell wall biosynthesis